MVDVTNGVSCINLSNEGSEEVNMRTQFTERLQEYGLLEWLLQQGLLDAKIELLRMVELVMRSVLNLLSCRLFRTLRLQTLRTLMM